MSFLESYEIAEIEARKYDFEWELENTEKRIWAPLYDSDFVDDALFLGEFYENEEKYNEFELEFPLIEGFGRYAENSLYNFRLNANPCSKSNKNHNSTKQRLLHRQGRKLEKKIARFNFKSDGNYDISKYLEDNKNFHYS